MLIIVKINGRVLNGYIVYARCRALPSNSLEISISELGGFCFFCIFSKNFSPSLAICHVQNGIEAKGVRKPPPAVREGGELTLGADTIPEENRSASI